MQSDKQQQTVARNQTECIVPSNPLWSPDEWYVYYILIIYIYIFYLTRSIYALILPRRVLKEILCKLAVLRDYQVPISARLIALTSCTQHYPSLSALD